MDDLLDQFEQLLSEYQRLVEASIDNRDAHVIMAAHHEINEAARDALDFLIEHDATVTFPSPSAAPFDPNKNFKRVPGGWDKRGTGG